jgi:hypothetical protein
MYLYIYVSVSTDPPFTLTRSARDLNNSGTQTTLESCWHTPQITSTHGARLYIYHCASQGALYIYHCASDGFDQPATGTHTCKDVRLCLVRETTTLVDFAHDSNCLTEFVFVVFMSWMNHRQRVLYNLGVKDIYSFGAWSVNVQESMTDTMQNRIYNDL